MHGNYCKVASHLLVMPRDITPELVAERLRSLYIQIV